MISNSLTDVQRDCLYACIIAKGHNPTKSNLPKGSFYRKSFGDYQFADQSSDAFAVFSNGQRIVIAFRGTDFSDDLRFLGKQIFTKDDLANLEPEERIIKLQEEISYGVQPGRYSDFFTDKRIASGNNISPLHGLVYQIVRPLLKTFIGKSVILTGSSMGGSIAIYVARIFAGSHGVQLPVVAFTPAFGFSLENWKYNTCLAFREVCDEVSKFANKHVQVVSFVLQGSNCETGKLKFHDIENYVSRREFYELTGKSTKYLDSEKEVVQIIQ